MTIPELDPRFSGPDAVALSWEEAERALGSAERYWFATVRHDGQPHVTPLFAVWDDGALHVCTGPGEQKAVNLAANPRCTFTTGYRADTDIGVALEGEAVRVLDDDRLRELAEAWVAKYGEEWRFGVGDGAFQSDASGEAHVFRVVPAKVLAWSPGDGGQTRYRFPSGASK